MGPDGRGVLVATANDAEAVRDREWLRAGGIPAALPADEGLVSVAAPYTRGEATEAWFFGDDGVSVEARWWAEAVRRPALVSAGEHRWIARPDGSGSIAGDLEWVASLLDVRPPTRVAVFGGAWIREDEPEYLEARRFGELCAERRIDVINGGYGGVMAAVSAGARAHGARVIGVTITSFSERVTVNEWLTHELEARDLLARLPLICDAEAWVAFPGGVGTLAEVALCWNLVQTGSVSPRPLVIVGERWDRALATFRELLLAEHVHFDLVRPAATAEEAFGALELED